MIQKNNEAMPVKNRIEQLIKAMSEGIWEKDYIFALGLLTAVAEESLFLRTSGNGKKPCGTTTETGVQRQPVV